MKKHTFLYCFLLVSISVTTVSLGQDRTLTIATFNCEFLTRPKVHIKFGLPFNIEDAGREEQEAWAQPGARDLKYKEAAQAVAEVVHAVGADVIALVEVGNDDDVIELRDEILALGLDYPHAAVGRSRDTATRQYVAVLSRYPLSDFLAEIPGRESFLEEPDDPDTEDDTGVSKGMRVTVSAFGHDFLLYVVHLASERGGHEQDQQRIAQASIVRRHYLPALRDGALVIVAGDLNDKRGQPAIHRIRGFDDIDEDLIQTGLYDYFARGEADTRWTYQYQGIRQQIDHILLSRSIRDLTTSNGIRAHTVAHDNALASDHRPLVVTLQLQE
jgi:endonuclease/exonuclease/phosphatase family metal-dependent hydrolase